MTIDVSSIKISEKEVIITGVDIEKIWCFTDKPAEDEECEEISYKFDITLSGARRYLYLMTKNNKISNAKKYMDDRLNALIGQTIYISNNFRIKD